jgi:competence ComEA-like helix-hairpin-helix protein
VKGLAEGLGVEPRAVSSPTFVIAQQYALPSGPEVLHHVDLYRLESAQELESIGFSDLFAPGSVLAVEWADRFPGALGRDVLRIEFEGPAASADGPRRARVSVEGDAGGLAEQVGADWQTRVAALEQRARADRRDPAADATLVLILALLVGVATIREAAMLDARIEPPAAPAACERFAPAADDAPDALGTRRLRCAVGPDTAAARARFAPPVADGVEAPADRDVAPGVTGLARLLVGASLDPNRASAPQLEALPGIGPTRAAAIVAHRSRTPFRRIEDLESVHGIGPATRRRLSPWLAVSPPGSPGLRAGQASEEGGRG